MGGIWTELLLEVICGSRIVKVFDDVAKALFNNNFKVLDGPDAPDMNIVKWKMS